MGSRRRSHSREKRGLFATYSFEARERLGVVGGKRKKETMVVGYLMLLFLLHTVQYTGQRISDATSTH